LEDERTTASLNEARLMAGMLKDVELNCT